MYHLEDQLFRSVFDQLSEPTVIIKSALERRVVLLCNKAFRELNQDLYIRCSGMDIMDFLKDLKLEDDVMNNIYRMVQQAFADKHTYRLQPFSSPVTGNTQPCWWRCEACYIDSAEQDSTYVMVTFRDITELIEGTKESDFQADAIQIITRARELNAELAKENTRLNHDNRILEDSKTTLEIINAELSESNQTLEASIDEGKKYLTKADERLRAIIEEAPVAIAVLDGPDFIIESANTLMLALWRRDQNIIGRPLLAALPELRGKPYEQLLKGVYDSGESYHGSEAFATLGDEANRGGGFYNFVYQPLKDEAGDTYAIIVEAHEVTELVQSREQAKQAATRLNTMVASTPMAMTILRGRDLIIEIANSAVLKIWGRPESETVGRSILDVFPELLLQDFPGYLENVFNTGKPFALKESPVIMQMPDGSIKNIIVNFSYDPIFDGDGAVESILATVHDVTEVAETRHLIEERNQELQALHEELLASNEELTSANEQLSKVQDNLSDLLIKLAESESRFRQIFEQAPIGICVLTGPDFNISLVNDAILKIWGRTREQTEGKPHRLARPELNEGPFMEWIEAAYHSGTQSRHKEVKVSLYNGEGKDYRQAFVNSIHQPFFDVSGNITGIILTLSDVTEEVLARQESNRSREKLKLAVELADLGTWYLDLQEFTMVASDRLKHLLGYNHDDNIGLEEGIACVDAGYREMVRQAIHDSINFGKDHDMEFPVTGYRDGKKRWLKSSGKRYLDERGNPLHFSGTVLDITARKLEEIRKNDFIAIVSHELKTPLTTLKAYLQMLHSKTSENNLNDSFIRVALKKSLSQIDKMNLLVKGFLDVSRLENSTMHLEKTSFDLNELLNNQMDDMLLLSQSHRIEIKHQCNITVEADRDKIAQVLGNLLSNAMKYSPVNSVISIQCEEKDGMAVVSITDKGIGIKPDDLKKIFDRFYRVENEQTKTIAGFGIGLYLCSEIISRHRGNIWATSGSEQGSTFFFSLPLGEVKTIDYA